MMKSMTGVLLGLTSDPELQVPLFIMFTLIYLTTPIGNVGIIMLTLLDSHLRMPMCFSLSDLSLADVYYSSAVIPTILAGFTPGDKVISCDACAAQMFFFSAFATVENHLLASMAYHRYAAACKPLHYTTTMTRSVCTVLAAGSCVCGFLNASVHTGDTFSVCTVLAAGSCVCGFLNASVHTGDTFSVCTVLAAGSSVCGFLNALVHTGDTFSLSFYTFSVVHHFFRDAPAVMVLSCSDRRVSELVLVYVVSFSVFFAPLVILISYVFIFITILKMPSPAGHQKALSTCDSHFTAVSIYYGTIIFMYSQPSSSHSMDTDKMASVFYAMIIPLLNPVIYSLRNKEVKSAFMKLVVEAKLSLGL